MKGLACCEISTHPVNRSSIFGDDIVSVVVQSGHDLKFPTLLRLQAPCTNATKPGQITGGIEFVRSIQIIDIEGGRCPISDPDVDRFPKFEVPINKPWKQRKVVAICIHTNRRIEYASEFRVFGGDSSKMHFCQRDCQLVSERLVRLDLPRKISAECLFDLTIVVMRQCLTDDLCG